MTPLDLAAKKDHMDTVKYLKEVEVSIWDSTNMGRVLVAVSKIGTVQIATKLPFIACITSRE